MSQENLMAQQLYLTATKLAPEHFIDHDQRPWHELEPKERDFYLAVVQSLLDQGVFARPRARHW